MDIECPFIFEMLFSFLKHSSHVQGVLDRFSQIKPKVLFSVEAVRYNQKEFWHLEKVKDVVKGVCAGSPL